MRPPIIGAKQQRNPERRDECAAPRNRILPGDTSEQPLASHGRGESQDNLSRMNAEVAKPCSRSQQDTQEQNLEEARIATGLFAEERDAPRNRLAGCRHDWSPGSLCPEYSAVAPILWLLSF